MSQAEKIPPHSEEAERAVLGSVLIDQDVFFRTAEYISADDFYYASNREIYTVMMMLYQANSPIDVVTVCDMLVKRKSLDFCGGRSYLAELSSEMPTTANAESYAKIIQEKAVYRRLISAGSEIVENSLNEKFSGRKCLDEAESTIFTIAKERQKKNYSRIQDIFAKNLETIRQAEKNPGRLPGLSTGFTDLDRATLGLQKSDLVIIAARPSMGKTAFALNIAANAAVKNKKRVVFFSVEMSEESVGMRFLSMQARVDGKKLKLGELDSTDWDRVNEALKNYEGVDLLIDETPGITVLDIRNKCRRMNAEKPLDLIMIDYLQIMTSDVKVQNRVNEIGMMTMQLKQLAREMECPVVVLSQLSRSTVQRKDGDKRPELSDLRDSGNIEQDADVVMFIHREDYYRKKEEAKDNIAEIIIAKQRQGETGRIKLSWQPKYQRFSDYIKIDDIPGINSEEIDY